jgi:hypothetical protein
MSDIKLAKDWFQYSNNGLISATHLFEDLHPKQIEIVFSDEATVEKENKT